MFIVKTRNTWRERALILTAGIGAGIGAYAATGMWWVMLLAQVAAIEAAHVLIGLRKARQ
jgi:hypothetical protein